MFVILLYFKMQYVSQFFKKLAWFELEFFILEGEYILYICMTALTINVHE